MQPTPPPVAPLYDRLSRFREAAAVEYRLLDLEAWLERNRHESDPAAHRRTMARGCDAAFEAGECQPAI